MTEDIDFTKISHDDKLIIKTLLYQQVDLLSVIKGAEVQAQRIENAIYQYAKNLANKDNIEQPRKPQEPTKQTTTFLNLEQEYNSLTDIPIIPDVQIQEQSNVSTEEIHKEPMKQTQQSDDEKLDEMVKMLFNKGTGEIDLTGGEG